MTEESLGAFTDAINRLLSTKGKARIRTENSFYEIRRRLFGGFLIVRNPKDSKYASRRTFKCYSWRLRLCGHGEKELVFVPWEGKPFKTSHIQWLFDDFPAIH